MEDINNLCQIKQFCVKIKNKIESETAEEKKRQTEEEEKDGRWSLRDLYLKTRTIENTFVSLHKWRNYILLLISLPPHHIFLRLCLFKCVFKRQEPLL